MTYCPGACTLALAQQRSLSPPAGYPVSLEYRCACDRGYHRECPWSKKRLRAKAAQLRALAARIEAEVARREEGAE